MQSFKTFVQEFKLDLEYHNELNPILWENDLLRQHIRLKLLEFARAWADFAEIPSQMIEDVILTGGNCNFNYTAKSDLDVHILVNRDALSKTLYLPRTFLDKYLSNMKTLWTLKHKISVEGFSIEPYAQDIEEKLPKNQGAYSLMTDTWLQKPVDLKFDFAHDKLLKKKVKHLSHTIKYLIKSNASPETVSDFKNSITSVRGVSIAVDGEFAFDNLVFKALRNRGDLDRLDKYTNKIKDRALSL